MRSLRFSPDANVVWAHEEITRLSNELARTQRDTWELTKERDEARREVCEYLSCYYGKNSAIIEAQNTAERRGWDCYKEKTQ